jgi:hypothetical protein
MFVVVYYIFLHFGILNQEKSGNPGTLFFIDFWSASDHGTPRVTRLLYFNPD